MVFERVPLKVVQAAEAQQLGIFQSAYKNNLTWTIIDCLKFTLLGGCGWLFLAASTDEGKTKLGLMVIGLLLLCWAIYKLFDILQHLNRQVYLFERGIIITTFNQIEVLPWHQVTDIWVSVTKESVVTKSPIWLTWTSYRYTLRRKDGYKIRLTNSTKYISLLGEMAQKGVSQELMPQALYAIGTGQTLNFPPYSINRYGLSKGRRYLPWSQVHSVEVGRLDVIVRETRLTWWTWNVWDKVASAKVPNTLVFTTIANKMIQLAAARDNQGSELPQADL